MPSSPTPQPYLGLEDAHFSQSPYHTHITVRATALALLRLTSTACVWDIGAGSGAISLEASSLAREGQVYAIESQPARATLITKLRTSLCAYNLTVVNAKAPDCLSTLPDPTHIFIGGGLAQNTGLSLLEQVATRLATHGRLVVSCVLYSTLQLVQNFFAAKHWPLEILQIQTAAAKPLATSWHLQGQNPVLLLAASKPIDEIE